MHLAYIDHQVGKSPYFITSLNTITKLLSKEVNKHSISYGN